MDRDRPMADGRDLFESKIREVLQQQGVMLQIPGYGEISDDVFHRHCQTDHVGAQDEASEARAVGDGVRPEPHLRGLGFKPTVFDEITDEFTRQMSLRFYPEGIKPIGHCKLEKMSDGSIHATIKYY